MRISEKGLNLIKAFEGLRLEAYLCPAKVWTIGYGHTGKVEGLKIKKGLMISRRQANELLIDDLEKFEKKVMKYNKKYQWTQNEFDSLVSFAFNVGSIEQLTALGTRSKKTIADKLLLYNKGGGKVLTGLARRRELERALFLTK